eukprot:tig00020951_g16465.t1
MTAVPVLTRINIVLKNSETSEDLKKMRSFDPLGMVMRDRGDKGGAGRSTPLMHDVKTNIDRSLPRTKKQYWTVEVDRMEPMPRKRRYDLAVGAAVPAFLRRSGADSAGGRADGARAAQPMYSSAAVNRLVEENQSLRQELVDANASITSLQDENEGLRETARRFRARVEQLDPEPAESDPPGPPCAAMRGLAAELRRVDAAEPGPAATSSSSSSSSGAGGAAAASGAAAAAPEGGPSPMEVDKGGQSASGGAV